MSFSNHFKFSECLSSHCKTLLLCFISHQMEWSVENGTRVKMNVPSCYLKYTMASICSGICTTITTLQCLKQPSCWGVCHVWHTSTNADYFSDDSSFKPHHQPVRPRHEWWPRGHAVGLTCCPSYVVYNAATHCMLTRCDDALLYPVSLWCVSRCQ